MPKEKHSTYTGIAFKRSKSLRKDMTHEEELLWHIFLKKLKPRFKRQKPIGNYIADFYCDEKKLIVEIDGSQHNEEEVTVYDQMRTEYFQSIGIDVIRFTNNDIRANFDDVCNMITYKLDEQ